MKAMLQFNLPEDQYDYDCAREGFNYRSALLEFQEHLRRKVKYEELSKAESKVYNEIRDKFFEILNEEGVELW